MKDSLVLEVAKGVEIASDPALSSSVWMWIAIAEAVLLLIVILALCRKRTSPLDEIKSKALSEQVDFDNLITSSFHAAELYDWLIKRCHPDRFATDERRSEIAQLLSLEIAKNKINYKRLKELEIEAREKLNIK